MATFLDFGFLKNFSPVFTFLFIFAVMYGIFSFSKLFNDNKGLQSFIALLIAILASMSSIVVNVISYMTPWFVLLFFFVIFMLIGFKVMGASDSDISKVLKGDEYGGTIAWTIIIISIVILLFAITDAVGQKTITYENETFGVGELRPAEAKQTKLQETIFDPKVLGMIAILLIAISAITTLSKSYAKVR